MRSATQIKSLGDVRTTISTHARAAPRREGSVHLEIYLLDKEKQRLQTEFAMLQKRQRRIETRLVELDQARARLRVSSDVSTQSKPQPASAPAAGAALAAPGTQSQRRSMPVEY